MRFNYKDRPAFILTEEQFTTIAGSKSWAIRWLGKEERKKHLPAWLQVPDTEHVAISGSLNEKRIIDGIEACGGIDRIRFEKNPKRWKGKKGKPDRIEQSGNSYHFVIIKGDDDNYYGYEGSIHGAAPPHHFDLNKLSDYYPDEYAPPTTSGI